MQTGYFVKMIRRLRAHEEVVLYSNILAIEKEEELEAKTFLVKEYEQESFSYPYMAPGFDAEAALWGAKTIYTIAQLILYREHKEAELEALLPDFSGDITSSAILSADLCLRFLPDMLLQLKAIDKEDRLIAILEDMIVQWHYSGIKYLQAFQQLDFTIIIDNKCLLQLYTDRVIQWCNLKLAMHPQLQMMVRASLGNFSDIFWGDFKLETTIHE